MKFNIPVIWMVKGIVEVDAETAKDAMHIAEQGVEFPLTSEPIDDTMELDCYEPDFIMQHFNAMKE